MQDQQPSPGTTEDPAICHQAHCPLQREDVDAALLADVVVAVLAGEETPAGLESGTINRHDLCSDCVRAVFDGGRPAFTEAEAKERVERAAVRLERRANRLRRHT